MINSKFIKMKIIERGLTQIEVANYIGITPETLSRWINGELGNINKFIKLCKFLNIDAREL